MLKDFKTFLMRGNVLDLAIGVIIGGAFGKIIASLVNDVLMPLISLLTGSASFSDLFVSLNGQTYATLQAAKDAGAATLNYGLFLQACLDFLIIALVIFLLIRAAARLQAPPPPPPAAPATKECPRCLSAIPAKASRCPHCTSEL